MKRFRLLLVGMLLVLPASVTAQFVDPNADREALPTVPEGFEVQLFAREPLIRQPCSMAFDAAGRLFVGMGPQYRNPTPETPGDRVVIVLDTDGDGIADRTQTYATGFNAIQGLAWHGDDLWVANAPDLTVVRDLDRDDEADEYVRIYTDLGNLEHGLHGLNWAPDGKLYMSKGNSKGLNQPGRYAPKPFRELWGMTAPEGIPDFPAPVTYRKDEYRHAYHDPSDDWGLCGGILRCDDGGRNLEIVCRGFRNPWDITSDSGFNWLGTDNDQTQGDRVFMSIEGAHFGWNHPWDAQWTDSAEAPTAPISGPLFEGSGTGLVYYDADQFPAEYQGVFFINDWLQKTTYVWRPEWDGALLRPARGQWQPFIDGGNSLYRPTDMEVGPDGALWVLGWSSGYGAEWKDGELTNEGRIFRVVWKNSRPQASLTRSKSDSLMSSSVTELIDEFAKPLPIWKTNAQDELVRRGLSAKPELIRELGSGRLSEMQETWTAWTLGRLSFDDRDIDGFFESVCGSSAKSLNLRIQSIRIIAHRIREAGGGPLPAVVGVALEAKEPRVRYAAVQAIRACMDRSQVSGVLKLLAGETDRTTYYAGWQALRRLAATAERQALLADPRGGVRRAALLTLLEDHALTAENVTAMVDDDDVATAQFARRWLTKAAGGGEVQIVKGPPLARNRSTLEKAPNDSRLAVLTNVSARSQRPYIVQAGGGLPGALAYSDRHYVLKEVPKELLGADLVRTANADDGSSGQNWLSAELLLPARVFVGIDHRQSTPPGWIRGEFKATQMTIVTDDGSFRVYQRELPAGMFQLGGNTDDGKAGGKSNYLVLVKPLPLSRQELSATVEQVLPLVENARVDRGEALFKHESAAGCIKCHSLDRTRNGFGPNLSDIGRRASVQHIVQSILQPSAVITEGFNRQVVVTDTGIVHAGILLEESGLSVTLGLSNGARVTILKSAIEERATDRVSAMPEVGGLLSPRQVADLTAFLLTRKTPAAISPAKGPTAAIDIDGRFAVREQPDRLVITHNGQSVGEYVFRDERILRPYFANLRAPGGTQVTRRHPPVVGVDATDHATMHPGLWLAFGDINGVDFWRNRGRMEHLRFVQKPKVTDAQLAFSTESQLVAPDGAVLARLISQIEVLERPDGWLIGWSATFHPEDREIRFGDQEEMGFGARVATALTEKNGGTIRSSSGAASAARTWGQAADWCDYSGMVDGKPAGIMLMADPENFRRSWWHNRDYGVFVANPFGRAAMKQGAPSTVTLAQGESLTIRFAALLHDSADTRPSEVWRSLREESP